MQGVGDYLVSTLKPQSCFFVSIRENEAYIAQKNVLRDHLKSAGIKVAGDESILTSNSDFTALSTKMVNARPDCLYVSAPVEVAANVVVQAKQMGLPNGTTIVGDVNTTLRGLFARWGAGPERARSPELVRPEVINDWASASSPQDKKRYGIACGIRLLRQATKTCSNPGGDQKGRSHPNPRNNSCCPRPNSRCPQRSRRRVFSAQSGQNPNLPIDRSQIEEWNVGSTIISARQQSSAGYTGASHIKPWPPQYWRHLP